MVRAFVKLSDEFPACWLMLVGDFEEKLDPVQPATRQIISTYKQIMFMGWQDDVRSFLAASDVFVLPSYREGFPNVVLQAGAMGLPCIVTDINGSNEIIHDGVNGLVVPPRDEEKLYDAMRFMLVNETVRQKLAAQSRALIVDRYERHLFWYELEKTYSQL